jgi:hypothetical protein
MGARSLGRALLATGAAALALAGTAQGAAASDWNEIPSQEEIDAAVASLANGTSQVVELKGQRPSWFTPELEQRVREDGVAAAPVDAPLPGEIGIRPGSLMISPFLCTMNYIFQSGGTLAIGTAGHCLEGDEPVILLTLAPTGGDPVLVELGRVLLRRDAGVGHDYGLVEIPPSRYDWVFPTISVVGGPCGVYGGTDPQPVAHYGHGLVVGTGGTPRAGMGFELEPSPIKGLDFTWDGTSYSWAGLLGGGDSGSAVRIGTLPAVGNLTHGIGVAGLPTPSPIGWGTKITTITGSGWSLVNSPLCPPGSETGTGDSGGSQQGGGGKGNGKGKRQG